MIFIYKHWENFCKQLNNLGVLSIPAKDISNKKYLVLKHDVETKVKSAFKMAVIENRYGHKGSYYVQAYLLENPHNIKLLKKIQSLGHEVSYHYDVLDNCKGDIEKSKIDFAQNKALFEKNGFEIKTVCQHGNPIVERKGYTSNRDFFRNETVAQRYPEISDIMVNYKQIYNTDFTYFSDAGRKFNLIFDPLTNDIVNSDDKNIAINTLDELIEHIRKGNSIISTHPHRWTHSAISNVLKTAFFRTIKVIAKELIKIPFLKRIMDKYYYLAKKI